MTNLEAKKALCKKLDISWDNIANNDLFSADDVQEWIQAGLQQAWDLRPWPFTSKTKTTMTTADDYYDHPPTLMPHSIFRLAVGGEDFGRSLRFEDYTKELENNSGTTEKLWSLHENFVFVNRNAYAVGVPIDMTGKLFPPTLSADADLLPFSPITDNQEHSGNRAIITLAYAEALGSEKLQKTGESEIQEKKAFRILERLWTPFADQRALQQSTRQMFDVPDFFRGSGSGSGPIGNFDL